MTPDTILLLVGLIAPMLILASVFVWDLISLPNFLRLLPANIKGEPEMKPNTHDTKNWKPMALFATISLLGFGAAIVLNQAPLWFGLSLGIGFTGSLASITLAFLHGVKNYKQAKAAP